ncbi:MAG: hypothetical protein ACOC4Y_01770 [bacterium]
MKNAGIDIGFGYVKATDGREKVIVPSVVGEGRNIRYSTGMNVKCNLDNLQLQTNGKKYFIGSLARRQSEMILSTLSRDRVGSTENAILFYTTLGLLCGQKENVNVVTGLPVSEYSDDLKGQLIDQLSGKHEFKLNSQTYGINVNQVKVIPQPLGTLFTELLTEHGKILSPEYTEIKVGIIDIGHRTSDFVVADKLDYIDRLSTTSETALSTAYKYIARELNDKYGVNVTLQQIPELAETKTFNDDNIFGLVSNAHQFAASKIVSEVQSLWDVWSLEKILLTGGGGSALHKYINEKIEDVELVTNSQLSNVRGFFKVAQRKW